MQSFKKYSFWVCLGMQAIGEVFGGKLFNLDNVYHGIQTEVKIISKNDDLFKNLGEKILVVKIDKSVYHGNQT